MDRLKISKNRIKYLQSLKLKKYRQKYGSFLAEGRKVVLELITHNKFNIKGVYATSNWLDRNDYTLKNFSIPIFEVSEIELKKISAFKTPDAVCAEFENTMNYSPDFTDGWILLLDHLRDPGNAGSIIRTADWFGVKGIYLTPESVDVFNPKTIHATMGSFGRVPFQYLSPSEVKQVHSGWQWYLASLNGQPLYEQSFGERGILVIGNESRGITESLLLQGSKAIAIPRAVNSQAESLNAAVATGILLSHILK